MAKSIRILMVVLMLGFAQPARAAGQEEAEGSGPRLTAQMRAEVVAGVAQRLNDSYVSAQAVASMAARIRSRDRRGDYDAITDGAVFAAVLTRDLQSVQADGHLSVNFSSEPRPNREQAPSPEDLERQRRMVRFVNFGFERVDRLAGNVGYIELNGFADPEDAAETAIAAMTVLSHTDALIIDLRYNGGGVPGVAQLISTYFFSGRPIHLHSIHWREGNRVEQFWTFPHVPGPRYVGKPVYILTSRSTVSAPESFAYNLQALERATIVGESTAGAANPGRSFRINDHFSIFVPTGRAVNPVTNANWEGSGITPDIRTPAAEALQSAHLAALRQLLQTAATQPRRAQLESAIAEVERQ